jgi:zinc transporter, ZIP family
MIDALLVGMLGASTLLVGSIIALLVDVPRRALGLVMAFGAGVLLSAVAYELVLESFSVASRPHGPALGFFAGVIAFAAGSLVVDRAGGGDRKRIGGPGSGLAVAMVVGVVLDGIPESAVLGMTLAEGGALVAILVAVALSNLPEGMAATSGLRRGGHGAPAILALWAGMVLASGTASLAGFVLLEGAPSGTVGFVLAFAGGAILTMLAQTMMPEAFAEGGRLTGIVTSLGFAAAFAISAI